MNKQSRATFQKFERRRVVAELYLHGWSQSAIAKQLEVSRSTVIGDLRAVAREWRESAIRDFDEIRLRELQKIDMIERQSWDGWSRSRKDALHVTLTEEKSGQTTRKNTKTQAGDPRFLQQVQQCIAQRRSLLGLDISPPAQEEPQDAHVSLEVRRERVLALLAAVRERERADEHGTRPDHLQPADAGDGHEPGPHHVVAGLPTEPLPADRRSPAPQSRMPLTNSSDG